jgi:hypothetical protein
MSDDLQDRRPIIIRCPKCGWRGEKPLAWVRANATMQCVGCGVIIRLDQKRLPAPPPDRWWRNPRYLPWIVAPPIVALIAIATYVNIFPRQPAPVLVCARQPQNGDIIISSKYLDAGGKDSIGIQNGGEGNAIVIVRKASDGDLVVSFFVSSSHYAAASRLPDDTYRVRWIFGDWLGDDCMTFATPTSDGEFDELENLAVDHAVTFTLHPVVNGNARFHSIPLSQFYGK